MSTIGKVVVAMETQHAAFSRGIEHAQEGLKSLGESAESIKGVLEGALAFAGVEMGVSGLKEMVSRTIEATVSTSRLASSLGITTQSLQQLHGAGLLMAGVGADQFDNTLKKLTKTLGGAEEGNTKAGAALAAIGLSAKDLNGMGIDQAFVKIGSAISGIANPAARGAAEVALFGREGMTLGPMFSDGAEGIRNAMEETERLGGAMSEVDSAKIMLAHEQMERVGMAVQGVENQFTVALAPVLEAIAAKVLSMVPDVAAMQGAFITGFRGIAQGIGYVVDAYDVLKLAAQGVAYAWVGGTELMIAGINKLAEGIIWVANKMGADWHLPEFMASAEQQADDWRKQIGSDMAATADGLTKNTPESSKWGRFFDSVQEKATATATKMAAARPMEKLAVDFEEGGKKVEGILAELQKQVDTFGMTEPQKKLFDLKAAGASDADVKKATGLQEQIDKMQAWKKEQEEANKLIEHSMTPIEKYQEQVDKVQKLFKDGLITAAQQADAIDKAQAELAKDDKDGGEAKGSAVITRRFDFAPPQQAQVVSAAEQAKRIAADHLKTAQESNEYLRQLYNFGQADQQNTDVVLDV